MIKIYKTSSKFYVNVMFYIYVNGQIVILNKKKN